MNIKFKMLVLKVLLLHFLLSLNPIYAQIVTPNHPVVGHLIPEFKLNNIHHYSRSTFSPADVKGKWLILDFWSKGCTACVQSFPRLDSLQRLFKEDIHILLIANNDRNNKNIDKDYERYRRHFRLTLSIAYDSMLFDQFGVQAVPHVVIVDPEKKVYSITTSSEVTEDRLKALISGKMPIFKKVANSFDQGIAVTEWKPFKGDEDVSNLIIQKSVLAKNNGEFAEGFPYIDDKALEKGLYKLSGFPLGDLYSAAYFPNPADLQINKVQFWPYPILETKDSILFSPTYSTNTGLYNYGLIIPKEKKSIEEVKRIMQNDLSSCFGYNVKIEKRMMPYYRLTATEQAKKGLKVTTESPNYQEGPTGIKASNVSIRSLLLWIRLYSGNLKLPIIDETNLGRNIAINLVAVMTDINDVVKALKAEGLILEKSEKEMSVLVISDQVTKKN